MVKKAKGINMNTLRKLYTVVAENIRKAREKQPWQETAPTKLKVNDLVLVKDLESAAFVSQIHAELQNYGNVWTK